MIHNSGFLIYSLVKKIKRTQVIIFVLQAQDNPLHQISLIIYSFVTVGLNTYLFLCEL